jgi:hypothetical protein
MHLGLAQLALQAPGKSSRRHPRGASTGIQIQLLSIAVRACLTMEVTGFSDLRHNVRSLRLPSTNMYADVWDASAPGIVNVYNIGTAGNVNTGANFGAKVAQTCRLNR